jgi:hypothetical protein
MKKVGILFTSVIIGYFSLSLNLMGVDHDYSKYFRTDSALVYNWNANDSTWVPSSVTIFNYENGHVGNVLTRDYVTRAEQARTDYVYNTDNLLDTETSFYYTGGAWVPSGRNLFFYDSNKRVAEVHIQKWVNTDWATDRIQKNYQYDENNNLLLFQAIYWRNNSWTTPTTDSSYYDTEGKLIKRQAFYATGATDYRIIYTYNVVDLLTDAYAEYPSSTGWINWWLVNYQYNSCGRKISQIQYSGTGTVWLPRTKTVFFSHFSAYDFPYRKIPVCHKGHTIVVSKNALRAHLAHGDCIGECTSEDHTCPWKDNFEKESHKPPFTISPNPAYDRIRIKITEDDCIFSRVELIDFNGKLLRVINVNGQEEIQISRGQLKSGNYLIRLVGDETYSETVILK